MRPESIVLKALDGVDEVTIPLSNSNLETKYFRIFSGEATSDETKVFANLVWEVFQILKSHFPSKIILFEENLELCQPYYSPLRKGEILRR